MTERRIFTWLNFGPPPASAFQLKKRLRKTHQEKFVHSTENTRWAIPFFATPDFATVAPPLRIQRTPRVLEWAAGHGQATHSISITTASPISTSRTAWFPALSART